MTKLADHIIIASMAGSGPNLGDNLGLVILLLVVGIFAGMRLQKLLWQIRRGGSNWRPRRGGKVVPFQPKQDRLPDAAEQLRTVMKADFKAQPLLNKSEARLFRAMDKLVIELAPPGWQVMAQVSLGEILQSADKDAYACINSKRVDLRDGGTPSPRRRFSTLVDADVSRFMQSNIRAAGITTAAQTTGQATWVVTKSYGSNSISI